MYSVCIYLQHYLTDHELLSIFSNKSRYIIRCLPNRFVIFWYSIFIWYQSNLKSSIIYCLFSGGILICYLPSSFSLLLVLPSEVILAAILFAIKSPVASAVFWTTRLEAVFVASIPVFVAISINFLPYLSPNFTANYKKPYPLTYFLYLSSVECLIFIMSTQLLM